MWRLRTSGGRFLSITSLPATLGSDADNDLRLRHASVQPHHARFHTGSGGRLAVEALGAAVVGVGGRQVKCGTLGDGDELILGKLRFTLERTPGAPRTTEPAAAPGDDLISVRDKTLRFSSRPARRGLLDVDFAQLSGAWKAVIVLALLALGAGLLWGVSLLTGLLG